MKAKKTKGGRGERARRRRFILEALEPRVVLDAGLGAEVAQVAPAAAGIERFESADELQQFLVDTAVDRWKDLFGETFTQWPYPPYFVEGDVVFELGVPGVGPALAGDAPNRNVESFDGTNIQVAGVDEADIVKTDGEYLYISNDGRLSIIDARNPAELSLAAEIPFDSYAGELFVSGDRLVLLSHQYSIKPYEALSLRSVGVPVDGFGPQTFVTIYDIADRTSPILIQETTIDGNLTASRRIDNLVYLVTSDQLRLPRPEAQCEAITPDEPNAASAGEGPEADSFVILPPDWPEFPTESCVYETEEDYLARVADDLLEAAMPSFETIDLKGEVIASGMISEPTDTYKPLTNDASNVTSIVVIDLMRKTSEISASTSLINNVGSTVYASAQNIYITSHQYNGAGHTNTTLQQFAIGDDGTTVDLAAVGSVPGWLVNQFAIDEADGYLRVVTSNGWGSDRTNRLFVLEQLDTSLDVVGSIDEIATGETVFAVRFVGDEAFVVTFRVVDPLFTIDLSDPTQPAIAGELKIPGFSNYLHPISEDFVIGLGRDEGGFGDSPQLSLFDVSDFSLPTRVDKFVFEGATWSEAFYNHHAISYFPDSQIAVVPLQGSFGLCVDGVDFGACRPQRVSAFWVMQIDTASDEKTLRLLGKIEHDDALLRSLRIGENLFTISSNVVQVHELARPSLEIDELFFGRIAYPDYTSVDRSVRSQTISVLSNDRVDDDARIVEVGRSEAGGTITIAEDGKSLLYSPPLLNYGAKRDSFEYTVESGGRRDTAMVHVQFTWNGVRDRMVRLAKEDLAERLGRHEIVDEIRLISAEPREWDGCLGIIREMQVCPAVLRPGFEIVLAYSLSQFVYHTDTSNTVIAVNDPDLEGEDLINIRAEIVNAAGELVTSLLVGEKATLQIHADDLRNDARGVFAAYFDVLFDAAQVAEIGPINHGSEFSHGKSGAVDEDGLIDEVGGFNNEADPSGTLVVSIPFVAASPGELRFTLEAADDSPVHDSLLLGFDSPIPLERIRYGEIVIEVIESLHNEADPMDANMDGEMSPLDALVIMNHLNRYGAGPVNVGSVHALRAAAAEAHAVRFAADVNRDGFISPIDVLLIINALDARNEARAEGESVAAQTASATSTSVALVLLPTAAESRTRSILPSSRRTDTLPSIDMDDLFPSADTIDFAARTHTHRATPAESALSEDTFFAELESVATDDWYRGDTLA